MYWALTITYFPFRVSAIDACQQCTPPFFHYCIMITANFIHKLYGRTLLGLACAVERKPT